MGNLRKQKTKPFRKSILIICPGITEQGYIEALKADRYSGLTIEIVPKLDKADRFEDVFAVIKKEFAHGSPPRTCFYVNDMDAIIAQNKLSRYDSEKEKAMKVANAKLIVIESMPCIEFWFLLHFIYKDKIYASYENLKHDLRKEIAGYDKNSLWASKIYSIIKDKTSEAIKNAALTVKKKDCSNGACSYTNMNELIEMMDRIYELSMSRL